MKLLIIRHGDPDYSIDGLTEKGKREADLLAKSLHEYEKIDYYYSSPLGRAYLTAQASANLAGESPQVEDWLAEFTHPITLSNGKERDIPWDQLPAYWTQIPENFRHDEWMDTGDMRSGHIKEEYERVCQGLDALLARHGYEREGLIYNAKKPNRDTIALFCHFGMESVLLSRLLNISPMQLWHGTVALTSSLTTLWTEERREGVAYWRMSSFGDISHLYRAGEEPSFSARFCDIYSDESLRHD